MSRETCLFATMNFSKSFKQVFMLQTDNEDITFLAGINCFFVLFFEGSKEVREIWNHFMLLVF